MLYFDQLDTPIGPLLLLGDGEALVEIDLPAADAAPLPPAAAIANGAAVATARRQLCEYFAGTRTRFELALRPAGTEFQRAVWHALLDIPYGETASYADIARRLGRPHAMRAVGAANGANPLAIIVPCHRVIGSRGDLAGYGGGLPLKRWLLAHERRHAPRASLVLDA